MRSWTLMLLCVVGLAGCTEKTPPPEKVDLTAVRLTPPQAAIQRLSQVQYRNSVRDLVDADVVIATSLEPDVSIDGLVSVGSSKATISPLGVERYETAAFQIARQIVEDAARLKRVVPCVPGAKGCLEEFIAAFGLRVWRRPLDAAEVTKLADVGVAAAQKYNDPMKGIEFVIAAIFQSPNFLFRVELGEPNPEGGLRYSNYEMASRLSYFITNSTPDEALLEAAAAGELTTDAGVRSHAQRLIDSPAARDGVRNFFTELYMLKALDDLWKDTQVHTFMDRDLGPAAREETLKVIERVVFEENADFRTLFTTTRTYVDPRLAALYEIASPVTGGFGPVTLPAKLGRRGILGHASFLALQSHPVETSAVLRGKFVRTVLLCGEIPPPPSELNTGLPEPSETARTLRERSAVHQADPVCAGCHSNMDPIGLGFENFDAIGRHRTLDNGAPIDASGDIDGVKFRDAWDLGKVVADHPKVASCMARNLYRYANGQVEEVGEVRFLDALSKSFAQSGYRIKALILDIATSPAFRKAGEPKS